MNGTGTVVIGASDATRVSKPLISVGPDMVVGEGDGYVDVPVTLSAPAPSDVSVRLLTVQRYGACSSVSRIPTTSRRTGTDDVRAG